jgi:hypothetical protein
MSHHVSASASNPTGAVEVVRVSSSATTTAPVDGGGAAATSATGTGTTTPVSTVVSGQSATPAAGQSGTPGANLPVTDIEQASNTIQGAQADLSVTAGAERRLDRFDLVGGDGGGGGGDNAGQENANNAEGAVAQGTADLNVSETGVGGDRMALGEDAALTTTGEQLPDMDARSVQDASGAGATSTSASTSTKA